MVARSAVGRQCQCVVVFCFLTSAGNGSGERTAWRRELYSGCDNCGREIEAWDEGNPYYIDSRGKKRYAYHPDPRRDLCTGVDSPILCLGCGAEVISDSEAPLERCPECGSVELMDTWHLEGRPCPSCKVGRFGQVPYWFMIS